MFQWFWKQEDRKEFQQKSRQRCQNFGFLIWIFLVVMNCSLACNGIKRTFWAYESREKLWNLIKFWYSLSGDPWRRKNGNTILCYQVSSLVYVGNKCQQETSGDALNKLNLHSSIGRMLGEAVRPNQPEWMVDWWNSSKSFQNLAAMLQMKWALEKHVGKALVCKLYFESTTLGYAGACQFSRNKR